MRHISGIYMGAENLDTVQGRGEPGGDWRQSLKTTTWSPGPNGRKGNRQNRDLGIVDFH